MHCRVPNRSVVWANLIESLESRVLLAAYVAETLIEHFDLPQAVLDVSAPDATPNFGAYALGLGDINGDGRGDFAISATGTEDGDGATTAPGIVFVYSGATAQVLRTLSDGFADFGVSLANIGDVDGDGRADLLVGSPRHDASDDGLVNPEGASYIYSGASGTLLRTFLGAQANSEFGHAVAAAGLADGDGIPDVMIGAPDDGPDHQGRVYILKGADVAVDQRVIYTFTGAASGDRFGVAIAPADLQTPGQGADPSPDYLIGAPGVDVSGSSDSGLAYLYRQSDGSLGFTMGQVGMGAGAGTAVLAIKTQTDAKLLVGVPGFLTGAVVGFTATGTPYQEGDHVPHPRRSTDMPPGFNNHRWGSGLTSIGDVDGDGAGDYAVMSTPSQSVHPRELVSGQTSQLLEWYDRPGAEVFGTIAFAAGDVDGDGTPDVIEAAPASGEAKVVSSLAITQPENASGSSEDLSFLFYSSNGAGTYYGVRDRFAIIDGVERSFGQIPGMLPGDTILGVNNTHLIVGAQVIISNSTASLGEIFILSNGVRTLLSDAVTSVVGGVTPDFNSFQLVKVGNDGSVLFEETATGVQRAWAFKDGVLTFLWNGTVSDVNLHGTIVGERHENDGSDWVLRSSTGETTILEDFSNVGAVTDSGIVYGGRAASLLKWENGVTSDLGSVPAESATEMAVSVLEASETGEVILNAEYFFRSDVPPHEVLFTRIHYWFFTPSRGMEHLSERVFGHTVVLEDPLWPETYPLKTVPLGFASGTTIVTGGPLLRRLGDEEPWVLRDGSPVSSVVVPSGSIVYGVNNFGNVIKCQFANGVWTGSREGGDGRPITDVLAFAFAGEESCFYLSDGVATLSNRIGEAISNPTIFTVPITANASLFVTADGIPVLAGTDASGHLLIAYLQGEHPFWTYEDITHTQIEATGQTFVPVAGGLTTFATSWGSNHIAYLDAAGNVQVVWWAPGMANWHIDNLSAIAGAPAITGPLTSLTTPWNGLNVIGANPAGELVTVWWAPDTVWQYATYINSPQVPLLDAASLTTFTTPWNAMNIVGRDVSTGTTVAYWWLPGFAGWRADELITPSRPEGIVTSGRFSGGMNGDSQILFAREAATGHMTEIFWLPGQTTWDVADITLLVA